MKALHPALPLLTAAMLAISGCVAPPKMTTKAQSFPLMYEEKPLTVFIMPPINRTTAADAKEYYSTTVTTPLAFHGFYVFPMQVTNDLLKSQGMYDTEVLQGQPLNKFAEYFGADAVLFTEIRKWDKAYAVLAANLTVGIEAKLVSTKTNRLLWTYHDTIIVDLSGGNSNTGNIIADLVAKAIVTSINTAVADYVPYAQAVTYQLMESAPLGKYHVRSGQDQQDQLIDKSGSEQSSARVTPNRVGAGLRANQ